MCTESGMILFKVHCNNITDTDSLNHLVLLFFFYNKIQLKISIIADTAPEWLLNAHQWLESYES